MDDTTERVDLENELAQRREQVYQYLLSDEYKQRYSPDHIREAVYSYIHLGGKSLRPAVLLFSCGAVGGEERLALPAAAAIEVYHTWTLVHDDIIDRDRKRRGAPTVHEEWRRRALKLGHPNGEAHHYGISIAILAGDIQQSWAISLLCELHTKYGLSPALVLQLIQNLQTSVISRLVEGETLDIQFSHAPIDSLSEEAILGMLGGKTGALYEFAAQSGAMIGLQFADPKHPLTQAITQFARDCGIAFQLQDDILGVIGDEGRLGKPVGSDLREGKRTTIVYHAFRRANDAQREILLRVLGNHEASAEDISEATSLLRSLGGIESTHDLARTLIERAIRHLQPLPASRYKDLLLSWARYLIGREF